jgi:predicted N-acetyltransferase YhbS
VTDYQFRRLLPEEFDAAMGIIVEVTDWLLSKGIRQWLQPIPAEIYQTRQEQGENYGLFADDELAAVVSLLDYRPPYWEEYLPETPYKWLATLASSRRFKGQGLGELTIGKAELFLADEGYEEIYLDCFYGQGVLPQFYGALGYEQIARRDLEFPFGVFDSVLMKKSLLVELG